MSANIITIIKERNGNFTEFEGTIEELLSHFGYTLQSGKCYEHERGNKKVNLTPKTGASLVTALNNAVSNSQRGNPTTFFTLKTK